MNIRRMSALLAAIPISAAPAVALAAEAPTEATTATDSSSQSTSTTAESSSESTSADVAGIVTVSDTSADTRDGGSASAHAVQLGGQSVVGGDQQGTGTNSGNLVSTGDNEQGHLHVAPWQATVDGDGSSSRTAVVDGNLGGEDGVSVVAFESRSAASRSGSSAETTGVYANLGGNELRLLHARTDSTGEGESYLVDLFGQKIGTNEQFDGNCVIPADPLAHVNCLQANAIADENLPEGADSGGEAVVGDVSVLDGALTGDVFTGRATQGPGDDPGDEVVGGERPEEPGGSGALPRTGAGLASMLAGLLTLGAGERLRRWKR